MNTHETFRRDEAVHGSTDRAFGLVFAGFFAVLAFAPMWWGRPIRLWAVLVGAAFLAVSWLSPRALAPLNRLWTRFGLLLNKITNPVVLGVLFYLVFTPFGVVTRLFGRDALRLKFEPRAPTYWLPRQPPGPPPASMKDQF